MKYHSLTKLILALTTVIFALLIPFPATAQSKNCCVKSEDSVSVCSNETAIEDNGLRFELIVHKPVQILLSSLDLDTDTSPSLKITNISNTPIKFNSGIKLIEVLGENSDSIGLNKNERKFDFSTLNSIKDYPGLLPGKSVFYELGVSFFERHSLVLLTMYPQELSQAIQWVFQTSKPGKYFVRFKLQLDYFGKTQEIVTLCSHFFTLSP